MNIVTEACEFINLQCNINEVQISITVDFWLEKHFLISFECSVLDHRPRVAGCLCRLFRGNQRAFLFFLLFVEVCFMTC